MSDAHLINFSRHPLTAAQRGQVGELLARPGLAGVEVREPGFDVDWAEDLFQQCRGQVDALGIDPADWHGSRIWVIVPDLAAAAAVVIAEIHGRSGHFPGLVWRRPQDGAFGIGGAGQLDDVRLQARGRR